MKDLGYLAQDISILHRQYYKDTGERFKDLGLNPTAACILLAVKDQPNVNQAQISAQLVIDKGLTTREINKLRDLGYVNKQPGKGKSVTLTLTDAGSAVVPQVSQIRESWWNDRFAQTGITPDSPLVAGIQRVVNSITDQPIH
ncbi:MarR family winged helix-turn-helix transcriptional regulator [Levilactobacillus bambusae]|uniref:MarR family transcriptional regulator n=1 Tax=Levilactobacillus bambusae TaxID=2024736 RepID=A0A2V1N0B5_9LACO|nr:MarR family transcriptional regulator [Levilactobacillus bambusae]PWF99815.1 MarR family transcriptional regulator [Levilactobacillus bambusae]